MERPKFVAELTINHLGMVNIAKAMIKSAKEAGADFVKLKMKKVEKYYKAQVSRWRNLDFIAYRKSLELSEADFQEISAYCDELNIPWFATVHDETSLEFIRSFSPPFYKVASMDSGKETFVKHLLEVCQEDEKPLVLSLGGKSIEEKDYIVNLIKEAGVHAYLLHTVSIYPTPRGQNNIGNILELSSRYSDSKISIGYSGHEEGYSPSLLAFLYGAKMIERHVTLSKDFKIHHIQAALDMDEFKQMIDLITKMAEEISTPISEWQPDEMDFLKKQIYS